jgi:putative ABC transport system ATP-binding protein
MRALKPKTKPDASQTDASQADAASHGYRVDLTGVTKTYGGAPKPGRTPGLRALDAVSLRIEPGEAVALIGPSGSGKSTLLHLIGAMDNADVGNGRITVGEWDLAGLNQRRLAEYRRTVGFVFQRFHLLPALTAADNVIAPVLPYRTSYSKRGRARELLAAVGLGGREGSLPSQLSGGQQQRVAIARALVNRPGILLADEPTGALDQATGVEVMDLLLGLRAEYGLTLLLATHDPAVAERCDRSIRLSDGRLIDDHRGEP